MRELTRRSLQQLDRFLFPPPTAIVPPRRTREQLALVAVGLILFSAIGMILRPGGFVGFDWTYYFSLGVERTGLEYYAPWVVMVRLLSWPGLIGATFTGLALALYQRRASLLAGAASFLTLPVLWVVFLGQIDGLVVMGLSGLPWLVPLATIKPSAGYFAFLADRKRLLTLIGWVGLSSLVWGFWPRHLLSIAGYAGQPDPTNISLWPWSAPVGLAMLYASRGDPDMLMLAGTMLLPYQHTYNNIVIVPAMARVPRRVALLAAAISWLPLVSNWLGPAWWYCAHLFPLLLWLSLFLGRRSGGC